MEGNTSKKIEQKFLLNVSRNNLIDNNDKLLVAFSGGSDSTFVLYLLKKYKSKFNAEIIAMHINHGLRGKESERDEEHSKKTAEYLGFPFFSEKINVKDFAEKNKLSLEEAARNLRYEALEKIAKKINASKIVTAHNLNDNTETVLLNIFKGKGLQAAAGIPVKRGKIIRPALSISKDEILFWLNENSIKFIEDSSNEDNRFLRNKLRNKIIPLIKEEINPSLDETLFHFSQILNSQNEFINYYTTKRNIDLFTETKERLELNLEELTGLELLNFGNHIKKAIRKKFGYEINLKDVEKIKSLITKQKGKKEELTNRLSAIKEEKKIIIKPIEINTEDVFKILRIGENIEVYDKIISVNKIQKEARKENCEIITGDNLSKNFIIRNWETGDKFIPLGMKGYKKISDFLTDLKIPNVERKKILVMENNEEIIWVIGFRISEKVKITKETKKRLEICVNTKN